MSRASDITTFLLKEYELCQSSAQSLEATVWQSAGLIGLVSIGTLALMATSTPSVVPALAVGSLSTASSIMWWAMAKRWWSIQHAKFRRMRHIEATFQTPGQMHYISFLDHLHSDRKSAPLKAEDPRVVAFAEQYSLQIAQAKSLAELQYHRRGPMEILKYFPALTALAWAVYVLVLLAPIAAKALQFFFILIPLGVWQIPGA
ncbi:MAG: hypothetical protein A2Y74_09225 [Actinobacteria bacterium RBG_13_63_9]|nr:MAG: hypothetical protein A2Y74_09225 [Actinobacteria bacterium RBG_13_63_9]